MARLLSRYRSRRRGLPDPLAPGVGNNPGESGDADGGMPEGDRPWRCPEMRMHSKWYLYPICRRPTRQV